MALLVVVLLGAGVLLGSFWLEWRHTRLGPLPRRAEMVGTARSLDATLEEPVRVEVLNGAGDRGAAQRVSEWLRALGFDVVFYGNASRFDHVTTTVLDRSGRDGAAREVADSLGVQTVVRDPEPELYLDATVILGTDWPALLAARDSVRRVHGRDPVRRRPF